GAGGAGHCGRWRTGILGWSGADAGVVASHPATAAARQMQALSIMAAFLELAAVAARAENLRPRQRPRKRSVVAHEPQGKPRSSRSVGQEFQGNAVDAVAQPRGRRAVLEDMAQMPA